MADSILKTDEAKLVERLHHGDCAAIEELYNAYCERLYSLVFNLVGRDRQTAEGIVQETFLAALKSLSKLRGRSELYTWLCNIAYHKISYRYRHQHQGGEGRNQAQGIHAAGLEQIQDGAPLASSLVEPEESRLATEQVLSSMPLDYQYVLTFKYIEDMSIKEISQIMGGSAKSVEGLLRRARQELRARLDAQTRDNIK